MLPTITLQVDDLMATQSLPDSNVLTQDAGAALGSPFANMLLANVENADLGGSLLPPDGNALPLLPGQTVHEVIDTSQGESIAGADRAEIPLASIAVTIQTQSAALSIPVEGSDGLAPSRDGTSIQKPLPNLNTTIPLTPIAEQPLRNAADSSVSLQIARPAAADAEVVTKPTVAPIDTFPASDAAPRSGVIARDILLPAERAEINAHRQSDASTTDARDRSSLLPRLAPEAEARAGIRAESALPLGTSSVRDRIPLRSAATTNRVAGERMEVQAPSARMQNSLPEVTDQLVAEVEGAQDSTKPTVLRYIPNPTVTIQAATNHPSQISASAIGDALVNTNRPAVDAAETPASRPALQHIELAVRETGWDKLVAERVLVMANSRLQNAEIRLTPAELGPLRVQLAVEDGAAHVTFQTQHALTREAIEQALPRLREMLAENGLSLGQANVDSEGDTGVRQHDQGNAGTERQSQESAATDSADSADTDIDQGPDTTIKAAAGNALVDTFA